MSEFVTTTRYGAVDKAEADIVIFDQHDGGYEPLEGHDPHLGDYSTRVTYAPFFSRYPQILQPYTTEEQRAQLNRYLDLERDIGATLIINEVIRQIQTMVAAIKTANPNFPGIRIDHVKVDVPRGLIDSNRIPLEQQREEDNPSKIHTHPIRHIFDHKEHPDLVAEFLAIHRGIYQQLFAAIESLAPEGIFLDMHTMNSKDLALRAPAVIEGPNPQMLKRYTDIRGGAISKGRRRKTNLLTRFPGQPTLVNRNLMRAIEQKLGARGIEAERDRPYSYLGFSTTAQMALAHIGRSLTIDVPMHAMCKPGKEDDIRPLIDMASVQNIAAGIADALLTTILIQNGHRIGQPAFSA